VEVFRFTGLAQRGSLPGKDSTCACWNDGSGYRNRHRRLGALRDGYSQWQAKTASTTLADAGAVGWGIHTMSESVERSCLYAVDVAGSGTPYGTILELYAQSRPRNSQKFASGISHDLDLSISEISIPSHRFQKRTWGTLCVTAKLRRSKA
jgi:hypothetical protein